MLVIPFFFFFSNHFAYTTFQEMFFTMQVYFLVIFFLRLHLFKFLFFFVLILGCMCKFRYCLLFLPACFMCALWSHVVHLIQNTGLIFHPPPCYIISFVTFYFLCVFKLIASLVSITEYLCVLWMRFHKILPCSTKPGYL